MASYLLFALGLLLIASPGISCWTVLFPADSAQQRVAWGSVLGIAAAVYLAYVCSFADLSWFFAAWAVPLVLGAGSFTWWHRQKRFSNPSDFAAGSLTRPNRVLVLLLSLIFALQTIAVMRHSVPDGWDPSFHLLLAKKIWLSGRIIRDWQPFENAALNYPLGSHLLVVLFARFSGLPLTLVFQLLMVTLAALTTLAIYTLASQYFASEMVGLYAAIAYSLWAWFASTDYLRWGGLPNQLGMLMGLAILSLVVRGGDRKKSTVLIALLFASVCLTHHHVMITMGFILAVQMLVFLATGDAAGRHRTIFFALILAAAAASFFLVPYALKAASMSETDVFRVNDHQDYASMGIVLIPFALAGAALDYFRKQSNYHVFHSVSATLLLLFVLFGPVSYLYQLLRTGQGFVAFTPSRFVTDLVYFFSIFAGYALYRWQEYRGWSARNTIAVAVMLAFANFPQWQSLLIPDPDRGRFAAYGWIANHTSANSILLTADPWASYAAWRRTLLTPMPVSEPRVPPRFSQQESQELSAGGAPEVLRGIQLLAVFGPGERKEGRLLWSNPDGWNVNELYSRRDQPNKQ
jgi:hypothetical protein